MGEVHRLPNTEEVQREASEWVVRLKADDVTDDDRARFDAWISAHPCHAKAYADLSMTWDKLVEAGPLVRAVNFGQVMNAAARAPTRSQTVGGHRHGRRCSGNRSGRSLGPVQAKAGDRSSDGDRRAGRSDVA